MKPKDENAPMHQRAIVAAAKLAAAPLQTIPTGYAIHSLGRLGRAILPFTPAAKVVRQNIEWVWPDIDSKAKRRIVRQVGENFGRVIGGYLRMKDVASWRETRHVEGFENLADALAQGRGAIIASAHFGDWEAIRLAARDAGVEVGIIYRAFNNPAFDAAAMKLIRIAGEPVLHKGRHGMRAMLAHLRAGGAMLVLVDQRTSRGEPLPFVGRDALTATAIAGMARKLGAPILPARALRRPDGLSFDVRFEPDIRGADDVATMRALNDRISAWVEEAPGQWFWLHRRWRDRRGEALVGQNAAQ